MKQDQLKAWQPDQFDRFVRILEQTSSITPISFQVSLEAWKWRSFWLRASFCMDKVGVLPCEKCRNCKLIEQEEFPDVTLIKPVNQVIKTERIRELVGQFSQAGIESQQQVLLSSRLRKCIPTQLTLCSRSSKNPE